MGACLPIWTRGRAKLFIHGLILIDFTGVQVILADLARLAYLANQANLANLAELANLADLAGLAI